MNATGVHFRANSKCRHKMPDVPATLVAVSAGEPLLRGLRLQQFALGKIGQEYSAAVKESSRASYGRLFVLSPDSPYHLAKRHK